MSNIKRTFELLAQLKASKKNLAGTLVDKGEDASVNDPFDDLTQKAGDYIPKSYVLVDEDGNEMVGVLVSEKTVFDAGVNDVRAGKLFGTNTGVETGEKNIPSYVTAEGYTFIMPNSAFVIKTLGKFYDFTKLQALFCPYNGDISNSVAVEGVAINEGVYAVNSADLIATVQKDSENQHINFVITNNSSTIYLLRYFTYKEIY